VPLEKRFLWEKKMREEEGRQEDQEDIERRWNNTR